MKLALFHLVMLPVLVVAGPDRSPWMARVTAQLARREYFATVARGRLQAPNRAQGLRTTFRSDRVEIAPRRPNDHPWSVSWSTLRWGREDAWHVASKAEPIADGATVRYPRGGLNETWENRTDGIEQSFAIERRPAGEGPLLIEATVARVTRDARGGGGLVLCDAAGHRRLHYARLSTSDAAGRALPGEIEVAPGILRLRIDDAGAVYPIVIDPIVTAVDWSIDGDQAGALYGSAVATAGDVNGDGLSDVVVGAPDYDSGGADAGMAFVYLSDPQNGLATTPAWTATPGIAGGHFGAAVAGVGDVNGDGYGDLLIGAPDISSGTGRTYLYLGGVSGPAVSPSRTLNGTQAGERFGASVGGAGDANRDGLRDVVIGAPAFDSLATNGVGRALVYYGSLSTLGTQAVVLAPPVFGAGAAFGTSVNTAGDVDRDGYADVIVGAPGFNGAGTNRGEAFIFSLRGGTGAASTWTIVGSTDSAAFGFSVSTAGDVNGDGYADVIVGAPLHTEIAHAEGKAYVYLGGPGGPVTSPSWTTRSGVTNAEHGYSVGTAGDVNGDGYADVIVGAPFYDFSDSEDGRAQVYEGSRNGLSTGPAWTDYGSSNLTQVGIHFGASVGTAGDVDGDGFSDIIVGSPGLDTPPVRVAIASDPHPMALDPKTEAVLPDAGGAAVYVGSPSGPTAAPGWTVESNLANTLLGYSVAFAWDMTGTGFSDLVVGAPFYDSGLSDQGAAFFYLGDSTGVISNTPVLTLTGGQSNAHLGWSVASAGDLNGDGYGDAIVGVPDLGDGRALIVHGGPSIVLVDTLVSPAASARFGAGVSRAGDVNGDGYGDVLIGAPNANGAHLQEGAAYLYRGSSTGLVLPPTRLRGASQDSCHFGAAVAAPGDVDRDGFDDVAVSAPDFDSTLVNRGRVYVLRGSANGITDTTGTSAPILVGSLAGEHFGSSIAGADVNSDRYADLIVGSEHRNANAGAAYAYLGSSSGIGSTAAWSTLGASGDHRGASVSFAGDVNNDGYGDVLVGSPGYQNGALAGAGEAEIYAGSATGLATLPMWTRAGTAAGENLGSSVAGGGDFDGDGWPDLAIGAPNWTNGQSKEGLVQLHFGGGGHGRFRHLRALRADRTTPVLPGGSTHAPDSAFVALLAIAPGGLEWIGYHSHVGYDSTCVKGKTCTTDNGSGPAPSNTTSDLVVTSGGHPPATSSFYQVRITTLSALFPEGPWFSSPYVSPGQASFRTAAATSSVDPRAPDAGGLRLAPPRPNPFRTRTTLAWVLPRAGRVRVGVFDVVGRRIATLVDGWQIAGAHETIWDGHSTSGNRAPDGVYLVRAEAAGFVIARRIVLLR